MTKLITILSLVVGFVLCVKSYPYDLDSWSNLIQEDMTGDKKVQFKKEVFLSDDDSNKKIGQVGGVDTLANGNLLVFHRGSRRWSFDTFVRDNRFNTDVYKDKITEKTLMLIDWKNMKEVDSWGSNLFHMPHGLTVDFEGKIWVTDVGLHQVMKFDLKNMDKPELVLGEALIPGSDNSHFCKPTDVAVSKSDGHIFVSDGYCNQRVVEFDKSGKFVKTFDDPKMAVVHSIALIESDGRKLVCVANRELGKIVCFDARSGKKLVEISHPQMRTVYAIRYDPVNNVLHAATGENHNREATGLTFDASESQFGEFLDQWDTGNKDLTRVHDLTTTPDGSKIFLGQLNAEIDMLTFE